MESLHSLKMFSDSSTRVAAKFNFKAIISHLFLLVQISMTIILIHIINNVKLIK